ncbi:MAG: YihY/virulence factor BrkB family protein [Candidatus Nanopelagicales bacterium]|nr:YihY/virulence factor BrkB family protein [Candidatus Nanopelagicales bacterium]
MGVPAGSGRTAAERVAEEGASPAITAWAGRIEAHLPALAPAAGFALSVYARFARHRGSVLAGGLAFFGMLSLVPAFVSLGAIVALVTDPAEFAADLADVLRDRPEALASLGPALTSLATMDDTSLSTVGVAGLVGLAVSLYAASRFVYVGRQVLDITFELEPQPPSVASRIVAIGITLLCQLAIVVGVVLLTLVPRVLELFGIGEVWSGGIRYLRLPLALALVYLLLTASMRFGTRARRVVGWRNVGAATSTAIILLGTVGLGWYLQVSVTYSQVVAILGGFVALQLWLYVVGVAIVLAADVEGLRHGFRRRDLPQPSAAA